MSTATVMHELTGAQAEAAMASAMGRVIARMEGHPMDSQVDALAAALAAGWVMRHFEERKWSEVWLAYDRFHAALGLQMDWRGGLAHDAPKLIQSIGSVLRSIETPHFLTALTASDRQFRRARMSVYRDLEQTRDRYRLMLDTSKDDQSTNGLMKRADWSHRCTLAHMAIEDESKVLFVPSWRCPECGTKYDRDVEMCNKGHLAQHVELVTGGR